MARDRVVAVIIERLLDAFGYDDRAREMHDRADLLLVEDRIHQHPLGGRAMVERHVLGDDLARAVEQIVDDRDRPSGVPQREYGVTADITGAAGDEDWDLGHRAGASETRCPIPAGATAPGR